MMKMMDFVVEQMAPVAIVLGHNCLLNSLQHILHQALET